MLKYSIKISTDNITTPKIQIEDRVRFIFGKELALRDLFIAKDGSYIYGSTKSHVTNGEIISLNIDMGDNGVIVSNLPIYVTPKKYKGYLDIKYKPSIYETISKYSISNNNDTELSHKYCILNDTIFRVDDSDTEVKIRYYFEDDTVVINGLTYNVNYKLDKNDNIVPYIIYGGECVSGSLDDYTVNEFIIYKEPNIQLKVDDVVFGDNNEYVWYNNTKYNTDGNSVIIGDKTYNLSDDSKIIITDGEGDYDTPSFIIDRKYKSNDKVLVPQYEWVKKNSISPYLFITVDDTFSDNVNVNDEIIIQRQSLSNILYSTEDEFIYQGKRYTKEKSQKKYVKIGYNEYELIETINNKYYYIKDNVRFYCSINANEVVLDENNNLKYKYINYDYVTINNIDYLIYTDGSKKYLMIPNQFTYTFDVIDFIGRSTFICRLNTFNQSENIDICCDINRDIVLNTNNYVFYKKTNTFNLSYNIGEINDVETYDRYNYISQNTNLYKIGTSLNIPITMDNNVSTSQNDEYLIQKKCDNIANSMVNSIIDMEHDVYSPSCGSVVRLINIKQYNTNDEPIYYRVFNSDDENYAKIQNSKYPYIQKHYIEYDGKECVIISDGESFKMIDGAIESDLYTKYYIAINGEIKQIDQTSQKNVRFSTMAFDEEYSVYLDSNDNKSYTYYNNKKIEVIECNVTNKITHYEPYDSGVKGYCGNTDNGKIYGVQTNNDGYEINYNDISYTAIKSNIISNNNAYYFIIDGVKYDVMTGVSLPEDDKKPEDVTNIYEIKTSKNDIVKYKGTEYTIINNADIKWETIKKIKFSLHFRVKDMTDWTTIENENKGWNIFRDTYIKQFQNGKFPPSDLLCFAGFTNSDVYYQKSKLGKSFIRLLFYDSPNPYTQNLLHMSTVFIDETSLYKKYCSNKLNKGTYKKVGEYKLSSDFTVQSEPVDQNGFLTYNENNRLGMDIYIDNKFSNNSSDGFYLYLYKNLFDNKTEENTIYLKVQFNHAGNGKIVDFIFPFYEDGDKIRLIDFNNINDDNVQNFKNGYELKDELIKHMYLPIRVKGNHYYLDPDMYDVFEPEIMKFNLFEVKINDDSTKTIEKSNN